MHPGAKDNRITSIHFEKARFYEGAVRTACGITDEKKAEVEELGISFPADMKAAPARLSSHPRRYAYLSKGLPEISCQVANEAM